MLRRDQIRTLHDSGFTWTEIVWINKDLARRPATFDLNDIPWQLALRRRAEWFQKELAARQKKGIERYRAMRQIVEKIARFYLIGAARSPWDFVKREYYPPKKLKDFQEAAGKRATDRTAKLYKPRVSAYARAKGRE